MQQEIKTTHLETETEYKIKHFLRHQLFKNRLGSDDKRVREREREKEGDGRRAVSYTHLDVYKRQVRQYAD